MKENAKNYYKLLNLPDFASLEEVRQSYYLLAQKHHPDRQDKKISDPLGKETFAQITQAFNTLKDPVKKKQYDDRLKQINNQEKKKILGDRPSPTVKSTSAGKGSSSIATESYQQGMAALQRKDYPRALYLFRTALKQDSQNATYMSYYALALIYNKGKLSESINYASEAIEKEPFRLEFKTNLARIYFTVGAKTQAEKIIDEILGLDPDDKATLKLAAQLQEKNKPEKKEGVLNTIKRLLGGGKK